MKNEATNPALTSEKSPMGASVFRKTPRFQPALQLIA